MKRPKLFIKFENIEIKYLEEGAVNLIVTALFIYRKNFSSFVERSTTNVLNVG
jgi:hypothetical protein